MSLVKLNAAVNKLRSGGAQIEVIHPDEDTFAELERQTVQGPLQKLPEVGREG